jgi:hypothetical protein
MTMPAGGYIARPCPGCGLELQPPTGVRWLQLATNWFEPHALYRGEI